MVQLNSFVEQLVVTTCLNRYLWKKELKSCRTKHKENAKPSSNTCCCPCRSRSIPNTLREASDQFEDRDELEAMRQNKNPILPREAMEFYKDAEEAYEFESSASDWTPDDEESSDSEYEVAHKKRKLNVSKTDQQRQPKNVLTPSNKINAVPQRNTRKQYPPKRYIAPTDETPVIANIPADVSPIVLEEIAKQVSVATDKSNNLPRKRINRMKASTPINTPVSRKSKSEVRKVVNEGIDQKNNTQKTPTTQKNISVKTKELKRTNKVDTKPHKNISVSNETKKRAKKQINKTDENQPNTDIRKNQQNLNRSGTINITMDVNRLIEFRQSFKGLGKLYKTALHLLPISARKRNLKKTFKAKDKYRKNKVKKTKLHSKVPKYEKPIIVTEPQLRNKVTEPPLNKKVTKPPLNNKVTQPQLNDKETEPQLNKKVTKPQLNNKVTQPQLNDKETEPPLNNKVAKPQLNNKVTQPQLNDKETDPPLNNKVAKPQLKNKVTQPHINDTETEPQLNKKVTKPQLKNKVTQPQLNDKETDPQLNNKLTQPHLNEKDTEPQLNDKVTQPQSNKKITKSQLKHKVTKAQLKTNVAKAQLRNKASKVKLKRKLTRAQSKVQNNKLQKAQSKDNIKSVAATEHDDNEENEHLDDFDRSDDNILISNKFQSIVPTTKTPAKKAVKAKKNTSEQEDLMEEDIPTEDEESSEYTPTDDEEPNDKENEEPTFTDDEKMEDDPADETWVAIGSGKTIIPKDDYRKIKWNSYTVATRGLLLAAFPRRVLATHSMTGKRSPAFLNKPAKMCLDPKKVSDIIIEVADRFKIRENLVRSVITTKCADESKMFKMRMKKREEMLSARQQAKDSNMTNAA